MENVLLMFVNVDDWLTMIKKFDLKDRVFLDIDRDEYY